MTAMKPCPQARLPTTGKGYLTMGERTCADCGGSACEYRRAKRVGGGEADMGIQCPNCGGQVDSHAGHIDNGRVFVCEKGKPLMREVGYYCRHCDSTVIFLKKCEPKGVGHD